jgi:hypothetical protein
MAGTTADHEAPRRSPDAHPDGYLSTACLHGLHDYCKAYTGAAGTKIPAQCKFCGAHCRCQHPGCHALAEDSAQPTARGLQCYVELPEGPDGHTGTSDPPQALSAGSAGHAPDGSVADQLYGRLSP